MTTTLDEAIAGAPPRCGETWADAVTEDVHQRMRAAEGHPTGPDGGCGAQLSWRMAWRCAECGRWMHLACLKAHFAAHTVTGTPPAAGRRNWPLTGGHGVPADSSRGHIANAEGALRSYRQAYGHGDLPEGVRNLLTSVERRLQFAREGLDLVAGARRELYLARDCACVLDEDGLTVLPCSQHEDQDDGVRRTD